MDRLPGERKTIAYTQETWNEPDASNAPQTDTRVKASVRDLRLRSTTKTGWQFRLAVAALPPLPLALMLKRPNLGGFKVLSGVKG